MPNLLLSLQRSQDTGLSPHLLTQLSGWDVEQKEVPLADLSKTYSPKCPKQANQQMHFYCETCKMLACGTCATIDHRSADHHLSEIADAVRSYRQEVEDVLQKFQQSKEEFKAIEEAFVHVRNRLKKMVTRACSEIQAKEEEEIAKIKNKSRILRDKVTDIGKKRDDEFVKVHTNNKKKMERAEKIEAAVTDLIKQADDFELLNLKPKGMNNLELQKDLQFDRVKHSESFIGVKCQDVVSDKDLGEILHEEKWKLKTEFGGKGDGDGEFNVARGVCCFSNGDVAVNDNRNARLTVFTSTEQYKTKLDVNATHGFAITPDDQLLVNCDGIVKVHDTNYRVISQFKSSQTDETNTPVKITGGIAVDKDKRVAVVNKKRTVTSLQNLDGSLILDISKTVKFPEDITVSAKGRLIFTNYGSKKLRCVEMTGKEVFTVSTSLDDTQARPVGVCCDDAGDIYISFHCGPRTGSSEVRHYDSQGVYVGCVAKELYWPFGITFSPSGELVVANYHSVKIFHQV